MVADFDLVYVGESLSSLHLIQVGHDAAQFLICQEAALLQVVL